MIAAMRILRVLAVLAVLLALASMPPAQPGSHTTRLGAAPRTTDPAQRPRTRHLQPDGSPTYTNRLIGESSPYLLQHAHNPVDWYPWGDEAFRRARDEGRPILLSVGYSTCHWCHVMEEESFEDEEIAAYLNANYVAIKVDREERPDVDAVYMAAIHLMGQRGGWPMTVWLTPDLKPFYGGSYLPPRAGDRGARIGFLDLLVRLKELYDDDPERVVTAASSLARRVQTALVAEASDTVPGSAPIRAAVRQATQAFDHTHGGFGTAPKFPRSVELELLLRYHRRTGDAGARDMAERTLEAMAAGGIHDHVGGGFHRYSTDARWLVPHFEKMLYDNALLAVAYLEGFQATGRPDFAAVARDVLAYVARDMTDPSGAFWAATDADSEGEEGRFYLWTPDEIRAALPADDARLAIAYWAVTEDGNFEGRNILHTPRPLDEVAASLGMDGDEAQRRLAAARERLREVRDRRVPPHTDRKIIAAWNGLMISAFARAARVLGESALARTGARAMDAVLRLLADGDRLRRHAVHGRATGDGFLDDYAFTVAALLDLWEATFELRWLDRALALQRTLDQHFLDPTGGGYFATAAWHERLLAREKPDYDGAEPCGNSVALQNLLRLHALTTDDAYRARAEGVLRGLGEVLDRRPGAVPRLLVGLDFHLDRAKEIVVVTPVRHAQAEPFLARLRATFLPNHVLAVVTPGREQRAVARRLALVAEKTALRGRATAYVCEHSVCDLPTADPDVFVRQISSVAPLP